jgi:hypothetical protein
VCLIKYHTINTNKGVEVQLHAFLNPGLGEGERSASRPGRFILGERSPVTIAEEGMLVSEPVWKRLRRKTHPFPFHESNPDHPPRSSIYCIPFKKRVPFTTYNKQHCPFVSCQILEQLYTVYISTGSRDSSVSITTRLRDGQSGFDLR